MTDATTPEQPMTDYQLGFHDGQAMLRARPAVASEGLQAALERVTEAAEDYHNEHPCEPHHAWPCPRVGQSDVATGKARAALASDTGSVGALDVERLWRAIEGMGLIEYGQLVPFGRKDAERIAAAYDAERQGER